MTNQERLFVQAIHTSLVTVAEYLMEVMKKNNFPKIHVKKIKYELERMDLEDEKVQDEWHNLTW